MPIDVLQQLKDAISQSKDDKLKEQLYGIIDSAKQSSTSLEALRGIVSALTAGQSDLSKSLQKVVFYFQKFQERAEAAKKTLGGLSSYLYAIDAKPLEHIGEALIRIEKEQKALSAKAELFSSSALNKNIKDLDKIRKTLQSIYKSSSNTLNVEVVQKQSQSFASGGQVHYTPSNTRKAKTGGRFTGKRTGDREIAFVNAGEAIITQRAIKSGARQSGMSINSYINSLNSGNLSRIKRGRSFAGGSGDPKEAAKEAAKETKQPEIKVKQEAPKSKGESITIKVSTSAKKAYKKGNYGRGVSAGEVNEGIAALESAMGKSDISSQHKESLKQLKKLLQSRSGSNVVGLLKHLNISLKKLAGNQEALADFNEELQLMGESIGDNRDKATTFGQAMSMTFEDINKDAKNALRSLDHFGEWLVSSQSKTVRLGGAFIYAGKQMTDSFKQLKSFVKEQAQLNKKLAEFNSTASLMGQSAKDFDKFRTNMNLTRQEASGLTDAFRTIGIQGNISFGQISTLAQGIKSQFGKLDTSMLKEAVNLIKDLPTKQIDVLINGKGSLDDKANLLANLSANGNIQATAKLITQGAFGQVQGITPNMSQSDKKMIQLQSKISKSVDDIYKGFNDWMPDILKSSSLVAAGYVPLFSNLFEISKNMTYHAFVARSIYRGGAISTRDEANVLNGKAELRNNLRGGVRGIGGGLKNLFGGIRSLVSSLKPIAPMLAGLALVWAGSKVNEWGNERFQKSRKEAKESQDYNFKKYKIGSTREIGFGDKVKDTAVGSTGKIAGWAAIGAGIGTVIAPGIGTAIGAALGGLVGIGTSIYQAIKLGNQAKVANEHAGINKGTMELIKRTQKLEEDFLSYVGFQKKDTKREIVEMAKIEKQIKFIADGAYSQKEHMAANAAINRNKSISQIGGTDSSFSFNASQAILNARIGAEKEYAHLSTQKEDILKNSNLSEQGKRVQLAKVAQAEIKVQERLINVLNASIAQYEKLPSAIKAAMISAKQLTATEYKNENFVGTSADAVASFEEIMKSSNEAQSAIFDRYSKDIKQLDETIKGLDQQMRRTAASIDEAGKSLGLESIRDAKGNIDRDKLKKRQQQLSEADKAIQLMITQAARSNPEITKLQRATQSSKDFADSMVKEEQSMTYEKYSKMSSQAQADFLSGIETKIDKQISAAEDNLKNIEAVSGKDSDEYKKAAEALAELKGLLVRLQKKKGKKLEQDDFIMGKGGFMDLHKMSWESARKSGQAANASAASKAFDTKIGQDFLKKMGWSKKDVLGIQRQITQITAISGAQDPTVLKKRKQAQMVQKVIEEYKKLTTSIEKSIDLILNSAQIMYNRAMAMAKQTSLAFDAYSSTGTKAVTSQVSSSMNQKFASLANAFEIQQKLLPKLLEQAEAQSRKAVESMQAEGVDQEFIEYYKEQEKLVAARNRAMLNPTAENQQLVRKLSAQMEKFQLENGDKIEKWKKLKHWKYMEVGPIRLGKTFSEAVQKMAKVKNEFIMEMNSLPEKLQKAISIDPRVLMAEAEKNLASERGTTAAMNVDFEGMKNAVPQVMKYAAQQRDMKIKIAEQTARELKDNMQSKIPELEEKFMKEGLSRQEAHQKALQTVHQKGIEIDKRLQAQKLKIQNEAQVKAIEAARAKTDELLGALGRRTQGFQIQKDLLNSIGAPFEMVLEIEQGIVNIKRQQAQAQQQLLDEMIAKGASQKLIQEQKLKTAKAQASVLKAAFGAQRDSLDKMLGKMMGTFQDVGGIFDMDNKEKMAAKKFGQGYGINGAGMFVQGGANAHNSYKQRVLGNANMAMGGRAQQMMNGHMAYDHGFFSGKSEVNEAFNNTNSVIRSQDVNDQTVTNLYVKNFDGLGGAQGASHGGFVYPDGKIRAFAKGGPSDPRDNIPALLRKGEFVLTPQEVKSAVSFGEKVSAGFGGGAGDKKEKLLASILSLLVGFFKLNKRGYTEDKKWKGDIKKQSASTKEVKNKDQKVQEYLKSLKDQGYSDEAIKKLQKHFSGGIGTERMDRHKAIHGTNEDKRNYYKKWGNRTRASSQTLRKYGATEAQIALAERNNESLSQHSDLKKNLAQGKKSGTLNESEIKAGEDFIRAKESILGLTTALQADLQDTLNEMHKNAVKQTRKDLSAINRGAFGGGGGSSFGAGFYGGFGENHMVSIGSINSGKAASAAKAYDMAAKHGLLVEDSGLYEGSGQQQQQQQQSQSVKKPQNETVSPSTSVIVSDYDKEAGVKDIENDDKANKTQKVIGKTLLDMRDDVNKILKILMARKGLYEKMGGGAGASGAAAAPVKGASSKSAPVKSEGKAAPAAKGGKGEASKEGKEAKNESPGNEKSGASSGVYGTGVNNQGNYYQYQPGIYAGYVGSKTRKTIKNVGRNVGRRMEKGVKTVADHIRRASQAKAVKNYRAAQERQRDAQRRQVQIQKKHNINSEALKRAQQAYDSDPTEANRKKLERQKRISANSERELKAANKELKRADKGFQRAEKRMAKYKPDTASGVKPNAATGAKPNALAVVKPNAATGGAVGVSPNNIGKSTSITTYSGSELKVGGKWNELNAGTQNKFKKLFDVITDPKRNANEVSKARDQLRKLSSQHGVSLQPLQQKGNSKGLPPGWGPNTRHATPPPGPDGKIPTGRRTNVGNKPSTGAPSTSTALMKVPNQSTALMRVPKGGASAPRKPFYSRSMGRPTVAGTAGTAMSLYSLYSMGSQLGNVPKMNAMEQALFFSNAGLGAMNLAAPVLNRAVPSAIPRMGRVAGRVGPALMLANASYEGWNLYKNWDKMSDQQRNDAGWEFAGNRAVDAAYLINPLFGIAAQGVNELGKHYRTSNRQIEYNGAVDRYNAQRASYMNDAKRESSRDPHKFRAMNDANIKMLQSLGRKGGYGFTRATRNDRNWFSKNKQSSWFGLNTGAVHEEQRFNMGQNQQSTQMSRIATQLTDFMQKYNIQQKQAQKFFNDEEFQKKLKAATEHNDGQAGARVIATYMARLSQFKDKYKREMKPKVVSGTGTTTATPQTVNSPKIAPKQPQPVKEDPLKKLEQQVESDRKAYEAACRELNMAANANSRGRNLKKYTQRLKAASIKKRKAFAKLKASQAEYEKQKKNKEQALTPEEQKKVDAQLQKSLKENKEYQELGEKNKKIDEELAKKREDYYKWADERNILLYENAKEGEFVFDQKEGKFIKYDESKHQGLQRFNRRVDSRQRLLTTKKNGFFTNDQRVYKQSVRRSDEMYRLEAQKKKNSEKRKQIETDSRKKATADVRGQRDRKRAQQEAERKKKQAERQAAIDKKTIQGLRGNKQYQALLKEHNNARSQIKQLKKEERAELQSVNANLYDQNENGEFVFYGDGKNGAKFVKYDEKNAAHKGLKRYSRNDNNNSIVWYRQGTDTRKLDEIRGKIFGYKGVKALTDQKMTQIEAEARKKATAQVDADAKAEAESSSSEEHSGSDIDIDQQAWQNGRRELQDQREQLLKQQSGIKIRSDQEIDAQAQRLYQADSEKNKAEIQKWFDAATKLHPNVSLQDVKRSHRELSIGPIKERLKKENQERRSRQAEIQKRLTEIDTEYDENYLTPEERQRKEEIASLKEQLGNIETVSDEQIEAKAQENFSRFTETDQYRQRVKGASSGWFGTATQQDLDQVRQTYLRNERDRLKRHYKPRNEQAQAIKKRIEELQSQGKPGSESTSVKEEAPSSSAPAQGQQGTPTATQATQAQGQQGTPTGAPAGTAAPASAGTAQGKQGTAPAQGQQGTPTAPAGTAAHAPAGVQKAPSPAPTIPNDVKSPMQQYYERTSIFGQDAYLSAPPGLRAKKQAYADVIRRQTQRQKALYGEGGYGGPGAGGGGGGSSQHHITVSIELKGQGLQKIITATVQKVIPQLGNNLSVRNGSN